MVKIATFAKPETVRRNLAPISNMTDNRLILLSEPRAWLMRYFAPFIVAFVATGWYWQSRNYQLPLLLFIIGQLYWVFRFLPLKEVKLDGNYLIISNDFKKYKVHIDHISNLTTGG